MEKLLTVSTDGAVIIKTNLSSLFFWDPFVLKARFVSFVHYTALKKLLGIVICSVSFVGLKKGVPILHPQGKIWGCI